MLRRPVSTSIRLLHNPCLPWLTSATLLFSDVLMLGLASAVTIWVRWLLPGSLPLELYAGLWPGLVVFAAIYGLVGLYRVGLTPVEELRLLSYTSSGLFLVFGATTFLFKGGELYSRSVFLVVWLLSLLLVPLGRALVRQLFAAKPWWGEAVVIFGAGATQCQVVRTLQAQPGLGFKPIAMLDDDASRHGTACAGVPVAGGMDLAPAVARQLGVRYAVVAMPGVPRGELLKLLEQQERVFPHLLLIPDLLGFSSLWISPRDLGGMLALELRQQLLLPGPRLLKRLMDLSLVALAALPLALLTAVIALLIRLETKGPVFYGHPRIGQGGRMFRAWKFRSMVPDADRVLEQYLAQHPELREEWEQNQKLKNDPRVTRVGRFLRRTSLDELPQLWNVLKGEMSLVGPRPIVQEEVGRYSQELSLYLKVRPGLSGMWQVSGRNDTSYAQRVALDAYYVRNWSVWLDLYILARTTMAVLSKNGAY